MNQYEELNKYLQIFEEDKNIELEDELEIDKPDFLLHHHGMVAPQLYRKFLNRLKYISQFCGCDYTNIYNTKFFYSRYYHSLVVANMTWHFTHDKKMAIAALFHDAGTPCFAHTIDFLYGDSINQELSEKNIIDMIKNNYEARNYLKQNKIELDEMAELLKNPILDNKIPHLCTDRLDGVLGTCYIWLGTHTLDEIKEVYDDLTVLTNEFGENEIGFKHINIAEKFVQMVGDYATELQSNCDKFVLQYLADVIDLSISKNLFTLNDLYRLKESDLINIMKNNFESWDSFEKATKVISTNMEPKNYYISVNAKKRNVIPLVQTEDGAKRINNVTFKANKLYEQIDDYEDKKYGYVKAIKRV